MVFPANGQMAVQHYGRTRWGNGVKRGGIISLLLFIIIYYISSSSIINIIIILAIRHQLLSVQDLQETRRSKYNAPRAKPPWTTRNL